MIDPEDFEDDANKWIVSFIIKYFDKYHTVPTMQVLQVETKKVDNEILKISIIEQLKEAYKASDEDLRYVEEEFSNFCKNQQLKKALMSSVDLLKMGAYDDIRNLINKALKSGQDKNIGHAYEKDVESRYREDDRSPIPFPWKAFNNITQGGYGKGELMLLFGNPKGGKSWVAIAMAAHAISLGYNIVYYTLELSEGYVGKRFDAVFTGIAVDKCKEHRSQIDQMVADLKGKLRIKEFAAGRASLDNIESHLSHLEQTEEFKPDAIFIDYLDLLKNRNTFRKERREDIDDVYTDARGMARERRVPLISPSQVNRAGSQDDVIQSDKMAGSYGKAAICDFAVSLSRKRKDKIAGIGRFHIMGNRLGEDGITFLAKVNTSNGKIDIDEKPIDIDDEEEEKSTKYSSPGNFDDEDKRILRQKFFENSKQ
jgi:replicative DNA helicase